MRLIAPALLACLLIAGCTDQTAKKTFPVSQGDMMGDAALGGADGGGGGGSPAEFMDPREEQEFTPVPIASGVVSLSPENSKIGFVGTHVGEPKPRTGGFERFSGTLGVDEASFALKSVSVEIETESVWTQIGRLTDHLKNSDFFEVNEAHPD